MECICTQTKPRFILSSERVLGEWRHKGKNPLYWRLRGGLNPQCFIMQDSEYSSPPQCSHSSDLKIGTVVVTARRLVLQGLHQDWLIQSGVTVCILYLAEIARVICSFCLQNGSMHNVLSRLVPKTQFACCWDLKVSNPETTATTFDSRNSSCGNDGVDEDQCGSTLGPLSAMTGSV